MSFTQLALPTLDLHSELTHMMSTTDLQWGNGGQICLNTLTPDSKDYTTGVGSLYYDWDNSRKEKSADGTEKLVLPVRDPVLAEEDFKYLSTTFSGTMFEEVYNALSATYSLGRVRIMKSAPKTCLSWHQDSSQRIHYPIKTQTGCFMVIDGQTKHLPADTWWLTDTTKFHTAFNASLASRIHLVAVVL